MRMQNPRHRVRAFPRLHQRTRSRRIVRCVAVELRPPRQQLLHPLRSPLHQYRRRLGMDQGIASHNGVRQVQRHVLIAAHGHGNPALGIRRVRLRQPFLGDHEDTARLRQPRRCP